MLVLVEMNTMKTKNYKLNKMKYNKQVKLMNTKLIYRLLFILGMTLSVVACSNDEIEKVGSEETVDPDSGGLYHYELKLNCSIPDNDEGQTTRSVVYTWENGENMYFIFSNGDDNVTGKGTYKSSTDSWSIALDKALTTSQTAQSCEVYYFRDKGSEYANWIDLNATTAIYYTTNATYICPTANTVSINASLNRAAWRLRFKGSAGTKITLPKDEQTFRYYDGFYKDGVLMDGCLSEDIILTVNNDGYTPYIYGTFEGSERSKETITVINGSKVYTKEISASDLKTGESAYMTIPTATSCSGWNVENYDAQTNIEVKDFLPFDDAFMTQWKVGNTNGTFVYTLKEASEVKKVSTYEILKPITADKYGTLSDASNYSYGGLDLQSDTEYYLFAIAKNSSGARGPVLKYRFKTKAADLPCAEISNIKSQSSYKWTFDVALKNNAKSYYLATYSGNYFYEQEPHLFAYYCYLAALDENWPKRDWTSVTSTSENSLYDKISICTWGIDKDGNIGNHCVVQQSSSSNSNAKGLSRSNNQLKIRKLSNEQMDEMLKHMQVRKIN